MRKVPPAEIREFVARDLLPEFVEDDALLYLIGCPHMERPAFRQVLVAPGCSLPDRWELVRSFVADVARHNLTTCACERRWWMRHGEDHAVMLDHMVFN